MKEVFGFENPTLRNFQHVYPAGNVAYKTEDLCRIANYLVSETAADDRVAILKPFARPLRTHGFGKWNELETFLSQTNTDVRVVELAVPFDYRSKGGYGYCSNGNKLLFFGKNSLVLEHPEHPLTIYEVVGTLCQHNSDTELERRFQQALEAVRRAAVQEWLSAVAVSQDGAKIVSHVDYVDMVTPNGHIVYLEKVNDVLCEDITEKEECILTRPKDTCRLSRMSNKQSLETAARLILSGEASAVYWGKKGFESGYVIAERLVPDRLKS